MSSTHPWWRYQRLNVIYGRWSALVFWSGANTKFLPDCIKVFLVYLQSRLRHCKMNPPLRTQCSIVSLPFHRRFSVVKDDHISLPGCASRRPGVKDREMYRWKAMESPNPEGRTKPQGVKWENTDDGLVANGQVRRLQFLCYDRSHHLRTHCCSFPHLLTLIHSVPAPPASHPPTLPQSST